MSKYFLPKRKTKRNLNMKHFLSNFALCFCHQYRKCLKGRQGFSWTFLFCASCGQLKIQCQIMFRKLLKRQGQQEITSNFTQVVENHPLHLYYCYLSESPGFFLGTGSFIVKSKLITIIVGQSPKALVQGWSQISQCPLTLLPTFSQSWCGLAVNWQLAELAMLLDLCAMKEKHRGDRICVLVYHLYVPAVLPFEFLQVV